MEAARLILTISQKKFFKEEKIDNRWNNSKKIDNNS
jgi:hypothetical protein